MKKLPNITYTTENNLCTGCGVCEGACPSSAIRMSVIDGNFRPVVAADKCRNDKGCHLCYDICPGIGVNLVQIAKEQFRSVEIKEDEFIGRYLKCFSGYSNDYDIRYHSASGGMVSQFLIWLLEHDKIDGAVVTKFDKDASLLVSSYIATNKDEVIAARSTKYAPVTLNHAVEDIKKAAGNRYVIVGVPCHIEGFRKYSKIDKVFKNKVIGYFALYCSSGRSFYLTEYVFKTRGIDRDKLKYFQYRDEGCLGSMVTKTETEITKEPFQSYYHPLRSVFVPRRCTMCIDHYGELGDVSFGDIHIEPYINDIIGVSSLIVRNPLFLEYLLGAEKDGTVTLDEISVELLNRSQPMSSVKKYRNNAFIGFNYFFGRIAPSYDSSPCDGKRFRWFISYIHTNIQQFIGRHKSLWCLIPLIKGKSPKI